MKKIKSYLLGVCMIVYLSFLTIAFAGSILSIEITNSFFQFYKQLVVVISLGIGIVYMILIGRYVIVKKIHQKVKEEKEMIT